MTADTHRNGQPVSSPGTVHPDLLPPQRSRPKIHPPQDRDQKGSSGRTVNSAQDQSSPQSSATRRDQILDKTDSVLVWIKDFCVPPRWLMETPPGWDELTAFAHRDPTAPGLVRGLRLVWLYAVVLPSVAKARMREWFLARFSRVLVFGGIALLFIWTTPMGHWLAWLIRAWFGILSHLLPR